MALPIKPLAADSVTIDGQEVRFHALSRAACFEFQTFKGKENAADLAEQFLLEKALDASAADVAAFRAGNDLETVGGIVDRVMVLSGLATQAQVDLANARRLGQAITPDMLRAAGLDLETGKETAAADPS